MKERIAAGIFKAKCLRILDEVQRTRKEVIITKRGKPVARLVPTDNEMPEAFGWMRGTVKYIGDVISPIDVKWNADE